MSRYTVNSCICHDRTFEEILAYAKAHSYSDVEELQADEFCGCSCGLCIPYIELMFETGETEFEPGAYYRRDR